MSSVRVCVCVCLSLCQTSGGDSTGKLRDRFQLDSCLIRVDPQLAVAFEHIRHPQNLISQLGLDVDFNEDGLVIAGTAAALMVVMVTASSSGSRSSEYRFCLCCNFNMCIYNARFRFFIFLVV